jgi:hypothetical protein
VGDFVTFSGSLGSGRTTTALQIMECFTNSNVGNPIGMYLNSNLNEHTQTCLKAASQFSTISFGRGQVPGVSSVGVYMAAVKVIRLASQLKAQGNNVMLVIDNIQEILANEWTVLQTLGLPISAVSILNELYSNCSESRGVGRAQGSLTAIAITNSQSQDVLQEYSTVGNNTKHLRTLATPIEFPLQLVIQNNRISSSLVMPLRRKINGVLLEKKEKELVMKLKLNKEEPWEHYALLDSEWWTTALQKYSPTSTGDELLFLWFIRKNITADYSANWRISCIQAYQRYLDFLARPEDPKGGMDDKSLGQFLEICKSQKVFDIFKEDYLH